MQQISTINFVIYILKNEISDCSSTEIFSHNTTNSNRDVEEGPRTALKGLLELMQ